MTEAIALLGQASKRWRLATLIADEAARAALIDLAAKYEAQALALSHRTTADLIRRDLVASNSETTNIVRACERGPQVARAE